MSIRRRLREAAQAIDELHSDQAGVAQEFERFLGCMRVGAQSTENLDVSEAVIRRSPSPQPVKADDADSAEHQPVHGNETLAVPGLVFLDRDLRPVSYTPSAKYWLARFKGMSAVPTLPDSVIDLAGRSRDAGAESSEIALEELADGTLIEVQAWAMPQTGQDAQIVVAFIPASSFVRFMHLLERYQLTARERQVAQFTLLGRSLNEIAELLDISPDTVRYYLRAVFDKTGCRSRREFATQFFNEHQATSVPTVGSDGVETCADQLDQVAASSTGGTGAK
ncbi:helix-turn-helix transcriptional regulator [Streptomyces sp. NPDC020192]|uniref:helix-turn-helix transcriptional regulator n=1 Tax=Streptomyces sp. NPDC020192 TaxID=3365066 RepID=UPI0037BA5275